MLHETDIEGGAQLIFLRAGRVAGRCPPSELLGTSDQFPRRLIAERRIRFVRLDRHVRSLSRPSLSSWTLKWSSRVGRPRDQQPDGASQLRLRARIAVRTIPNALRRSVRASSRRPETYRTEAAAWSYLGRVHLEIRRGYWQADDGGGKRTLRECCEAYLEENPRLGAKWAETCRRNVRVPLTELLDLPIIAIIPPVVGCWHANRYVGTGIARPSARAIGSSAALCRWPSPMG